MTLGRITAIISPESSRKLTERASTSGNVESHRKRLDLPLPTVPSTAMIRCLFVSSAIMTTDGIGVELLPDVQPHLAGSLNQSALINSDPRVPPFHIPHFYICVCVYKRKDIKVAGSTKVCLCGSHDGSKLCAVKAQDRAPIQVKNIRELLLRLVGIDDEDRGWRIVIQPGLVALVD